MPLRHATFDFVEPALLNEIIPPHAQLALHASLSAGILRTMTVGEPGAHGAGMTGMHGIGVSTPNAAAVAAATCGLDGLLQTPNGGMFTIGLLSMMLPAGLNSPLTFPTTTNVDGAIPNVHDIEALIVTSFAMCLPRVSVLLDR